jgi:S-adenosylmethionine-diacylglycerol 3-amino-3-carboxypropyl transferase
MGRDVTSETARVVDLSRVRYAQVWEDARVLRRALRVTSGERVCSIAAAGDNALALLLDDPAEVVAVDLSAAQLALLELKIAALRALDHDELLRFLGVRPADDRLTTWRALAPALRDETRAFFSLREPELAAGILHAGRFERYFRLFRRGVLPLVQSRGTVRRYLGARSLDEQREVFERRWDNRRWRLLFRLFFSRTLLGHLGRDPSFFEHVDVERVGACFLERAERAFVTLPVQDNYVGEYIVTGGYSGAHGLPDWLRPESLPVLRERLDRLRLVQGDLFEVLASERGFDAFNLSDCFEWMSPREAEVAYARVLDAARPGARLCYWNLLVDRRRPERFATRVIDDEALARELSAIDRCFFYDRVVVERVRGDASDPA